MNTKTVDLATGNIAYETLMELHKRYLDNKHKLLPGNTHKGDTKSIWFKLDDSMRGFLTEVLRDEKVDGIRAYIIQYPQEQMIIGGEKIPQNPDDTNQLSIGFVTTSSAESRRRDYPGSITGNKLLVVAPPMNHGELCPRDCPTDPTDGTDK